MAAVDYESALNETRTDREQMEIPADFRISFESDAPPDGQDHGLRRHYSEQQLQPNDDYRGPLERIPIEEARALFVEMLERFHVCDWKGLPLPPMGLPFFRAQGFSEESDAARLLEIGARYVLALIRNEGRSMHLRWQEAAHLIAQAERRGEERAYLEQAHHAMDEHDRREVAQKVYFIASESGPVKIGIAVNPENRLRGLQTGHHERLALLAVCEGGQELEREYHSRFAAHRLHGEWFDRAPDIEAEIARLALA